ncbi:MAG: peroxidase family protein [Verrucomicrobiales bacterium]
MTSTSGSASSPKTTSRTPPSGETGIVILTDQFERLRDADRFWFQNGVAGGISDDLLDIALWDGANGTSASEWLEGVTLADILLLNTDVASIQQNVFFAEARPVPEPGASALLALVAAGVRLPAAAGGLG